MDIKLPKNAKEKMALEHEVSMLKLQHDKLKFIRDIGKIQKELEG